MGWSCPPSSELKELAFVCYDHVLLVCSENYCILHCVLLLLLYCVFVILHRVQQTMALSSLAAVQQAYRDRDLDEKQAMKMQVNNA